MFGMLSGPLVITAALLIGAPPEAKEPSGAACPALSAGVACRCHAVTAGDGNKVADCARDILAKLDKMVWTSVDFQKKPLREAIVELQDLLGLNIAIDKGALDDHLINLDSPVTLSAGYMPGRTLLNLVTSQLNLMYIIKDGVLQVTTEQTRSNEFFSVSYPIADLLGSPSETIWINKPREPAGENSRENAESFIKFITSTIAPNSWTNAGGAGTVQLSETGKYLKVKQTWEIHYQVNDLIKAFHQLLDTRVKFETIVLHVNEATLENIAANFNFDAEALIATDMLPETDNRNLSKYSQGNGPFGMPQYGFQTPRLVLASEQVSRLIQLAQQDQSTSVLQLPRSTLFMGQHAVCDMTVGRQFLKEIEMNKSGENIEVVHRMKAVKIGTVFSSRAMPTADQTGLLVDFEFTQTKLGNAAFRAIVDSFVISGVEDSAECRLTDGEKRVLDESKVSKIGINRQFQVGDGQTAVLFGGKTITETRQEFGPPFISDLPLVGRLFKNVGYGREAQVTLILVTPRVIVVNGECKPLQSERRVVLASSTVDREAEEASYETSVPTPQSTIPTTDERNAPRGGQPADESLRQWFDGYSMTLPFIDW